MNSVQFDGVWFDIPGDGIGYGADFLSLTVIANGTTIAEMEALLEDIPEVIEIFDEDHETKTGQFKGYTVLSFLAYIYNRQIYMSEQKADMIEIRLVKPDLEDKVEENTEAIEVNAEAIDTNDAQTFFTAMMTDTLLEEE